MFNYFLFKIKPTPVCKEYGQMSGGCATVFVIDSDEAAAEKRAREHVEKQGWQIVEIKIAASSAEEAESDNPQIQFLKLNANKYGISCCFDLGRGGQFFN